MLAKIYKSDKIRRIRRKLYRGKLFFDKSSGSFRMNLYVGGTQNKRNMEKGVKIFDGIVKMLRKQRFLTDYNPQRLPKYAKRFRKEMTLAERREKSYKQTIKHIMKED